MRFATTLAVLAGLSATAALAQSPAYLDRAAAGQIMISDYMDQTVYGPADASVGEIKDLLVDPATGMISTAVLGVGGFLGMGEKNVAIPFADLKTVNRNGRIWFAISATKEELKAAPAFAMRTTMAEPAVAPSLTQTTGKPEPAKDATGTAAAPLPGANSFTETQARSRLESMGYSSVGTLAKDNQSIWRGTAMKDGKSVAVAVDFKGNVVAQ